MRPGLIVLPLLLLAAPALAAGGGGQSSAKKTSNRYQASWTLAVDPAAMTGETEVVYANGSRIADEDGHAAVQDHAAPAEHGKSAADEETRLVDLPIVVAPLVVDGELVNYAFVSMQLEVAPGHDPWRVREQAAYLRDAMLRAAHRRPVNPPDDPGAVDPETAARVWIAAAEQVLGEGAVAGLHIVGADVRYPELAGGR